MFTKWNQNLSIYNAAQIIWVKLIATLTKLSCEDHYILAKGQSAGSYSDLKRQKRNLYIIVCQGAWRKSESICSIGTNRVINRPLNDYDNSESLRAGREMSFYMIIAIE